MPVQPLKGIISIAERKLVLGLKLVFYLAEITDHSSHARAEDFCGHQGIRQPTFLHRNRLCSPLLPCENDRIGGTWNKTCWETGWRWPCKLPSTSRPSRTLPQPLPSGELLPRRHHSSCRGLCETRLHCVSIAMMSVEALSRDIWPGNPGSFLSKDPKHGLKSHQFTTSA